MTLPAKDAFFLFISNHPMQNEKPPAAHGIIQNAVGGFIQSLYFLAKVLQHLPVCEQIESANSKRS